MAWNQLYVWQQTSETQLCRVTGVNDLHCDLSIGLIAVVKQWSLIMGVLALATSFHLHHFVVQGIVYVARSSELFGGDLFRAFVNYHCTRKASCRQRPLYGFSHK